MGYEVFLSRNRDDDLNANTYLADQLGANSWKRANWKSWRWIRQATAHYGADAFVSIHTNAGGGTGISAFYAEGPGKALAETVAGEIAADSGLNIRRIARKRFMILRGVCGGHTCLVECGFHDNPKDLALLLAPDGPEMFGKAIARGVDKYLVSIAN
jgi:N-acetylmuramoyl-L-alanine amidase